MSLLLLVTVHKLSLFGGLNRLPLWEKTGLLCEAGSLSLSLTSAGVEGVLLVGLADELTCTIFSALHPSRSMAVLSPHCTSGLAILELRLPSTSTSKSCP